MDKASSNITDSGQDFINGNHVSITIPGGIECDREIDYRCDCPVFSRKFKYHRIRAQSENTTEENLSAYRALKAYKEFSRFMHAYIQSNKVYLQLMVLVIAVPLIFWPDTQAFISVWINNHTYNHGFLILPISLWLLYRQRHLIASAKVTTEPLAMILLAFVLLLWFLAYIISVNVVQQFALVTMIPASVWILFGRKFLVKIVFPIAFLYFMIPVGASLVPPLMEITANFTVSMVQLTGIPIYREGLYFSLPTGNWSVVEACSGLNYLVASLTLGMLYAYLTYRSLTKRALFILVIALSSVIANGLRAYGVVIIGHLSNMKYGAGGDHEFYGWLFYGFFVILFFYLGNIWADKQSETRQTSIVNDSTTPPTSSTILLFAIIFTAMISTRVLAKEATDLSKPGFENIQISFPDNFGDWQHTTDKNLGWKPLITGKSITKTQSYVSGNDMVQISLGYYPWQSQGSEAVTTENRVTGPVDENWSISSKANLEIDGLLLTETEIFRHDKKILVWKWYLIGDWETSNPNIAKIYDALNIILFQRNDASFLTLSTPITQNVLDSREKLVAFQAEAHHELHTILSSLLSKSGIDSHD